MPTELRGIAVGVFAAAFQDLAIETTGPVLKSIAAGYGTSKVFLVGAAAAGTVTPFRLAPLRS